MQEMSVEFDHWDHWDCDVTEPHKRTSLGRTATATTKENGEEGSRVSFETSNTSETPVSRLQKVSNEIRRGLCASKFLLRCDEITCKIKKEVVRFRNRSTWSHLM